MIKKNTVLPILILSALLFSVALLFPTRTAEAVMTGFGYGSDDHGASLYYQWCELNVDGTLDNCSPLGYTVNSVCGLGGDDSPARVATCPANQAATSWGWSGATSGGGVPSVCANDGNPGATGTFYETQAIDSANNLRTGGKTNNGDYASNGYGLGNLKAINYLDTQNPQPYKVIDQISFSLAADGNVDNLTIACTTVPAVPVPVISAGSNTCSGGSTTLVLNWTNVKADEYYVFRDGTQIATVTGTSYTVTGLTPGSIHAYYVLAWYNGVAVHSRGSRQAVGISVTSASCAGPVTGTLSVNPISFGLSPTNRIGSGLISNTGVAASSFNVSASGISASWLSVSVPAGPYVEGAAGQTYTVTVLASAPTIAGTYPATFQISATPNAGTISVNSTPQTITVNYVVPVSALPTGAISADPNPCSIVSPATTCNSNITWSTANVTAAQVWVSNSGAAETNFGTGLSFTNDPAPWITAPPAFFDFNLYNYSGGVKGARLDTKRVTANAALPGVVSVTLNANPLRVITGNGTSLDWSSTGGATSCTKSGGTPNWPGTSSGGSGFQVSNTMSVTTIFNISCTNGVNSGSDSVTVTVSGTYQPPDAGFDSPASGATVAGPINITGWAVDNLTVNEGVMINIVLYVDGAFFKSYQGGTITYGLAHADLCTPPRGGACANDGWIASWDSRTVADGPHTFRVDLFDAQNLTRSINLSVNVLNNPPVQINGVCGTADGHSFASTDTSYGSFTQCSAGTPSNPAFPPLGGSTSWVCLGSNGGIDSGTCTASRSAAAAPTFVIAPPSASINVGQTQSFIGWYDPDGPGGSQAQQNVTASASWSSTNTSVATLASAGNFNGVGSGGGPIIRATYLGITANATLNVAAASDFRLQSNVPSQTGDQGTSVTYQISVTAIGGFSSNVSFSLSGLPAGASGSFSPISVNPVQPSTLTINIGTAAPGRSTFFVTGTSGSISHTIPLDVIVNSGSVPINGVLGTANGRTFASTDMSYGSFTQCSAGTSSNTAFPPQGGSTSWVCLGSNGGTDSGIGTATRSAAVVPAPTISFSVSPTSVTLGDPATLTWSVTDAVSCVASGDWSGTKPISGTEIVIP